MATKPAPSYDELKDEYAELWASMQVRPGKQATVNAAARKVLAGKDAYQDVEAATKVPWFVVGTIHKMEADCNFRCHLHNGDPLTARTRLVPKGRPLDGSPPFPWDVSAEDALEMKGLQRIEAWPVERIAYELERYNGFGYRTYHPNTLSPYLWSNSSHYTSGKYVADGKWDQSAVSGQSGAIPILQALAALDDTIILHSIRDAPAATPVPEIKEEPAEPFAAEFPKAGTEEEMVNAPEQLAPSKPEVATPPPLPPAPERKPDLTAADEASMGGWFSDTNVAKLNALSDKGSRIAGVLQKAKRWCWGLVGGTGIASQLVDTSHGNGNVIVGWVEHNALLTLAIVLGAVAGIVYVTTKLAEKYLITAADAGRYNPRGTAK